MQNPLLSIPSELFIHCTGLKVSKEVPSEDIAIIRGTETHYLRFESHRSGDDDITTQVLLYDNADKAMDGRVSDSLLQIKVRPAEEADHREWQLDGYVMTARVTGQITSYPGYSNVHSMNLLFFSYDIIGKILLAALDTMKYQLGKKPQ